MTTTSAATTTTRAPATTSEPRLACPAPFCLVYHISADASWEDGAPVTADDFAHTVSLNRDLAGAESAYGLIDSVEVIDEKTLMLSFSRPIGPWQTLFSRVFRQGEPANAMSQTSASGPFIFEDWVEGDRVSIVRNDNWWAANDPLTGARHGPIQTIDFVFISSPDEMVDALENGEVDVIWARPEVGMVDELAALDSVNFGIAPGPFWEHIDFHHDDPILSQLWARRAISLAIDREEILNRTVRLIDPDADPLDNTVFMADSVNYEAHFEDVFDPDRAGQILEDRGCTPGDDGVQVCGGERLSFVWASTDDDPARVETFESVREDLRDIGIEIVADLRSPSEFVTREFLFAGPETWQLINFSWRARSDPFSVNSSFYCGEFGDLNVNRYCSEEVERLIRDTETLHEPGQRIAAYNEADRLYLEDLALMPLYQKPVVMAWSNDLSGPQPNFSFTGDLWNVASWSGKDAITVALPTEPRQLSPLSTEDDSSNVIMGALMYGAFGMTPSNEYVPVLVDSVEIIEGDP